MAYEYLDPERETDPYSVPDVEIWEDGIAEVECECGIYEMPLAVVHALAGELVCPSCGDKNVHSTVSGRVGWFYQYGLPGCLPDSDYFGPFTDHDDALEEARENAGF